MELVEVLKTRRSVRVFEDREIDSEKIKEIIELATHAPSACDVQGWRFIVVNDQMIKDKIVDLGGSIIIKNAPVGILVVYDNRSKNYQYKDYIQSASAAIQNIHLVARNLGLGSCWVCHLPKPKHLKKLLDIPRYFSPIAYVLLGYPKNQPNAVSRKYTVEKIMSYNSFSDDLAVDKVSSLKLLIERILVRIYYLTPLFIKKQFLNRLLDSKFVKKFKN